MSELRTFECFVDGRPVQLERARSFWNDAAKVAGIDFRNTPRVKEYKRKVQICALAAGRPTPLFSGPVHLSLQFYLCGGRQADLTNYVKCVEDALNRIVYVDDRQVKCLAAALIEVGSASEQGVRVFVSEIAAAPTGPFNLKYKKPGEGGEERATCSRRTR
jgi:Holliday junction resolvase RusA-like endonuclease